MKRLLLLLAACGSSTKPAPVANNPPAPPPVAAKPKVDCAALMDKVIGIMAPEMKLTAEQRAEGTKQCAEEYAKDPDNPVYACLGEAKDKAAIDTCLASADRREAKKRPERGHGPRKNEAELQLNKLGKSAKTYFLTYAAFAKGTAKQLPAKPCCGQPNNLCAPTQEWQTDPVWKELDFDIDEENKFQYAYTSDGKTFHAEAVGDLDCDGITITYKLDGTAPNGNPQLTLTPPPPNSD